MTAVLTVVGARPQFIKAAAIERAAQAVGQDEWNATVVHTGQHYDDAMSAVFFRELGLDAPAYDLGVGSGGHGIQTGEMLIRLEPVIEEVGPEVVLVFGDTNSTLAGALAAAKLNIPVAHVEAGLRSNKRSMPEETNRVIVDHVSEALFCPSQSAVENLAAEGIRDGVHHVGDVMFDVLRAQFPGARERVDVARDFGVEPGGYVLATVHRAENTDIPERFEGILKGFELIASAGCPVLFPAHPRTLKVLGDRVLPDGVRVLSPLSYEQTLVLAADARVVATDSGGLQKEAVWLGTPCVTLRDETEWPETLESGWSKLAGTRPDVIEEAVRTSSVPDHPCDLYGDGRAAERIVRVLQRVQP